MTQTPIRIRYYSDILCVWGYIGQKRVDELCARFGDQVLVTPRFMSVFGDVPSKMENAWKDRGGVRGYAEHVHKACEAFPEIPIHEACWISGTPTSSLPCHLYLGAIRSLEAAGAAPVGSEWRGAQVARRLFFEQATDISDARVLDELCRELGVSVESVHAQIQSGAAFAVLSGDLELMRTESIVMSPTLTFNEGRQRLQGNVGYRLMEANVRELLDVPHHGASWC